ncbi:DUF1465 family protein [Polycladidibacter stylochi]|uniref:protease adaptor protein RcdA n=1 Tax=Polycladidibacter stylochi TaxID=1807766 RepID=UPI000AA1A727|nr:DUF1465 family protein [Pseudovibrio stylochi]
MPKKTGSQYPIRPTFLGQRLMASQSFMDLFHQGMDLIEETANYLDGAGKKESRKLEAKVALTYSTESMRLTTRLMQMASWLLLQRAVLEGELDQNEAAKNTRQVKLPSPMTPETISNWRKLPERFQQLINQASYLQGRIELLDQAIVQSKNHQLPTQPENPLHRQQSKIASAFKDEKSKDPN